MLHAIYRAPSTPSEKERDEPHKASQQNKTKAKHPQPNGRTGDGV
jgi:hypothetical protein